MRRRKDNRKTSLFRSSSFEICEERRLMACDLNFNPNNLFGDDGALHQLQNVIDTATVVGKQIPIIGEQIADSVPFGVDVREALGDVYESAAGNLEEKLDTTLNEVLGSENYAFLDDLIDVEIDTEACTATATIDMSRTLAAWDSPGVEFDVGLQALPIYASGDIDGIELEMGFDLTPFEIAFDLEKGGVELDTNGTTFSFDVNAGFGETAEISAQVGFLQMSISDGLAGDPNGGGEPNEDEKSGLSLGVDVVFGDNFSIDTLDVEGDAALKVHMRTEVADNMPSISADFILEYDLDGAEEPEARFENVSIGLGDIVSEFLGPVIELLDPILGPIEKVNNLLVNPIPVLSDIGLGDVSVMDIATGIADQLELPPDYEAYISLIDIVTTVVDIVTMFECDADCTEVMVNVGDFSLSDTNGDLRSLDSKILNPNLFDTNLSNLSIGDFADLNGLSDRIDGLDIPPAIKGQITSGLDEIDEKLSQGATLSFPIFDNPAGVLFQLLIGQNADLLRVDAAFAPGSSDVNLNGTLPIGISGGLRGGFAPSIHLGLGYDTFGLRRFIENHRTGQASGIDFLDGFYITDSSDLAIEGNLEAFVSVNALVFSAEASGGITAGIRADVIGSAEDPSLPDEDNEPEKVRFLSEMGSCAFAVSGSIDAEVSVTAKLGVQLGPVFLGKQHTWDIAHFQVASFDTGCVANPYYTPDGEDVTLAEIDEDTGVLTLLTGPRSGDRSASAYPLEINEYYDVFPASVQQGSVQVNAFGLTQIFEGVTRIEADMGSGFDNVTIAEGIEVDVEISGGDGPDVLRSFGSGVSTFYGGNGGDVLQGGTGANFLYGGAGDDGITGVGSELATIEISGEGGNDTITGGLGSNVIHGGAGLDTIVGGDGPNVLHGGPNDDNITGGRGVNSIFGESGADRITAGPGENTIEGGIGDDVIFTGAGSSTVAGGIGDDSLSWDIGDGTVSFDGGIGFDSIGMIGASGSDTFMLMNQSNNLRVLGPGFDGPVETISSSVEQVSVDGRFGTDHILVQPLAGTGIQRVNINLTDNLSRDGEEDVISIHGTPVRDELVVENVDVSLVDTPSDEPPVIGGVMRISGFLGHAETFVEPYEIFAMNFADRVLVNTHDANDLLTVKGATGPTFINTSVGDDEIHVEAVEVADPRTETGDYFSGINVDGGSGSNQLVIDETGTAVNDVIGVSDSVVSSSLLPAVHYQATDGGSFGQGIDVVAGGQNDTVNVSSTLRGNVTTVHGSGGDDNLVVDSDTREADGDLNAIRGRLVLNGGAGHTVVTLVDSLDDDPSPETVLKEAKAGLLDAVAVIGFAGPNDEVPVLVVDHADQVLQLRGSDHASASERFVVQNTILGETIIDDQQGDANYVVQSTQGNLQIVGGDGDELIEVTPSTQHWGDLMGDVSVDAGAGTDRVHIDDQATGELTFYELTANSLARGPAFGGTVSFDSELEFLDLDGANASSVFTVVDAPTSTDVNVDQGGGSNIAVGPTTGADWQIVGADEVRIIDRVRISNTQTLASGGGANNFAVFNGGSVSAAIIGTETGRDVLDYSNYVGAVTIDLEANSATGVTSFDRIDKFTGTAADDTLVGPSVETSWSIDGDGVGAVQIVGFPIDREFESFEHLVGGSGHDSFRMRPDGHVRSISGGDGIDVVNYALFSEAVVVDLLNEVATNVDSLTEVENAIGGAGDDTLRGDANNNALNGLAGDDILNGNDGDDALGGASGTDILIGGNGADTISGGADSDLLIAAATTYDQDVRSLESIRTRWSDDESTYRQRIAAITAQGVRAPLNDAVVASDTDIDSLFGGPDLDWIWSDDNDNLNDLVAGERVD
ncbi:calcium-binding protein [Planctomycetota bacterium]